MASIPASGAASGTGVAMTRAANPMVKKVTSFILNELLVFG